MARSLAECRVLGEIEVPDPVRLEPVRMPDPPHRAGADTAGRSHSSCRPVGRLLRRIVGAMRIRGENRLVTPVILYGTVISVMLYAAMSTIFNPAWKTNASFFVSLGAFLFCASDAVLAWNRFVSPIGNGRAWNISLYYLGQIGLIAGVMAQFG